MIVDSSILVAILLGEPGSEALLARLFQSDSLGLPAPSLPETGIVLTRRLKGDAIAILSDFLQALRIEIIPFSAGHAHAALRAFGQFGKGRHPAGLNFGDCIVCATARLANCPLFFVGDDFAKTDIAQA
jgi:ribonuclease VapC